MKDISEFKKGQFVKSLGGEKYEVMDYVIEPGRRKMETIASICRDIDTDKEFRVSWKKNKIFELYEPPE